MRRQTAAPGGLGPAVARPRRLPDGPAASCRRRLDLRLCWLVFAAAFFAVRLPFLLGGYGADTDAYRTALSGLVLRSSGEYLPSRLPGYPVHDLATALLLWGGPFLTNLATAVIAFAGVLLFDRIVMALHVPGRRWLLVAMGFTPWLIVTSAATLDYHWALTAMLGAYLMVIRGRIAVAGILLGVAIGCRITAGAFLLPLVLLLFLGGGGTTTLQTGRSARHAGFRDAAILVGITGAVALAAYLPVLLTYGIRFWNYAPSRVSADVVLQMVGQRALGAVGAIVTIGVVALSWRHVRRLPRLLRRDAHVLTWCVTILLYALIFLRLPVDVGYLVPIYPFAFLLVARLLRSWALHTIVIAALVSGVVDLDIQGVHNLSPAAAVREVRPSWRVANLPNDLRTRARWRSFAARIVEAPAPPHSVVLTLGAFPDVAVLNWNRLRYAIVERDLAAVSMISDNGALYDDEHDIVYLAVSEPRILERFRAEGYSVLRAEPEGPAWRVRLVAVP